ncbi:hypothetical protein [Arthrobacter sp. yr096]|uniref:hypothetical protein n=1 Tax=Arthrobacter sp. yr096 TaxID=1761750 RepID=UPI0015A648FE|nr:hypothetical protein [Arthrobacter sp. yr096]
MTHTTDIDDETKTRAVPEESLQLVTEAVDKTTDLRRLTDSLIAERSPGEDQ